MAFTLYTLIQTAILCINAIAVLHEERFLSKMGWGADQGVGGFGDDPGVKAQILNLIRSVRTVMRGGYYDKKKTELRTSSSVQFNSKSNL
uniref:Immediate early response 3-interacting protein 1 n=1 Tax=Cyprinodon variegatus TaxID=28743 RepID=A0A3Q2C9U7_CYPVA